MMKQINTLLVLLVISIFSVTFFPQSVANETTTTVGFNSTPIKDNKDFVQRIFKCVKGLYKNHNKYPVERQVPFDLIVAMAAYESAWGQSRFAKEGNNFFGIRTWDLDVVPHMKAKGRPDARWGVR